MSVSEDKVPGEEVGRLMAKDPDLGDNGHVAYRFVDGDGMAVFELSTDSETKEAIIKLKKVRSKRFVRRFSKNTARCVQTGYDYHFAHPPRAFPQRQS